VVVTSRSNTKGNAFCWLTGTYDVAGSVKRYATRDELEFGDACSLLRTSAADQASCRAFADGVLIRGINSAFEQYLRMAVGLKDQLSRSPDVTVAQVNSTLHSASVLVMQQLSAVWLDDGLHLAAEMYQAELANHNKTFQKVRGALAGVFFACITLLLLAVYEPLVRSLDEEFKKVRSVLIMVPLPWLDDIKVLAELVKSQA